MGKRDIFIAKRRPVRPYPKTLGWRKRHQERKEFNLKRRKRLEDWANKHGYTFKVMNQSHWILTRKTKRCEWWPGTAKLVINQQFDRGIHAHDWLQVIDVIEHDAYVRRRRRKSRRLPLSGRN